MSKEINRINQLSVEACPDGYVIFRGALRFAGPYRTLAAAEGALAYFSRPAGPVAPAASLATARSVPANPRAAFLASLARWGTI